MPRPRTTITNKNGYLKIVVPANGETCFEEATRKFQEAFQAAIKGKTTLTLAELEKLLHAVNVVHGDVYGTQSKQWAPKPSEIRPKNPKRN